MFDDMSGAGGASGGGGGVHSHHHHSLHGHAHSRGQNARSSSSSSNCQLRGKWEILLVFVVIFSGIVLTTLAVIKAKGQFSISFVFEYHFRKLQLLVVFFFSFISALQGHNLSFLTHE